MLNEALAQVEISDVGLTMSETASTMGGMSSSEAEPEAYLVESRYGELTFAHEQVMTMQRSILGFPNLTKFGLAKLPAQNSTNLVLLQSLEDANTSFPCFALDLHNPLIEEKDIAGTFESLGIKPEDGAILCILTVRQEDNGQSVITANLRAPVFVDSTRRMAWQVVLSNPRYPIRHQL